MIQPVRTMTARCSKCGGKHVVRFHPDGSTSADACPKREVRNGSITPRAMAGAAAEEYLYAAMAGEWPEFCPNFGHASRLSWLRQYPFGAFLNPPRGFRFDAAFPSHRLGIDVDGGAHAAGKAKQRTDTERRGLAGANGWVVVCVTPAQVHDGQAIQLVRQAIERRAP